MTSKKIILSHLFFLFFAGLTFAFGQAKATISGKIKNYHAKANNTDVVSVYVSSLIDVAGDYSAVKVDSAGNFTIPFDIAYPHSISFEYLGYSKELFISPGSKLFVKINANNKEEIGFEGDDAIINNELKLYKKELLSFYEKQYGKDKSARGNSREKAKRDSTPEAYKNFLLERYQIENNFVNSYIDRHKPSQLCRDYISLDLMYECADDLIRYPDERKKGAAPLVGWFDFFDKFPLVNDKAICTTHYSSYLYEYTGIQLLNGEKPNMTIVDFGAALYNSKIDLSARKKKRLGRIVTGDKKVSLFDNIFIIKLLKNNSDALEDNIYLSAAMYKGIMNRFVKEPADILSDIMISNFMYGLIEGYHFEEINLLMPFFNKSVKTDFLKTEIERRIKEFAPSRKDTLDLNINNDIHIVDNNVEFEKIRAKYKGKVIYVDFWATWCGPCREAMSEYEPLRTAFAGKDVVFVYLCISSPVDTWKKLVVDLNIKGENYHFKRAESDLLQSKFNITGLPHYMLIDKNGNVKFNNALGPENSRLVTEISKLLAQ